MPGRVCPRRSASWRAGHGVGEGLGGAAWPSQLRWRRATAVGWRRRRRSGERGWCSSCRSWMATSMPAPAPARICSRSGRRAAARRYAENLAFGGGAAANADPVGSGSTILTPARGIYERPVRRRRASGSAVAGTHDAVDAGRPAPSATTSRPSFAHAPDGAGPRSASPRPTAPTAMTRATAPLGAKASFPSADGRLTQVALKMSSSGKRSGILVALWGKVG